MSSQRFQLCVAIRILLALCEHEGKRDDAKFLREQLRLLTA